MHSNTMWSFVIIVFGCSCMFPVGTSDVICDSIERDDKLLWIKDTSNRSLTVIANTTTFTRAAITSGAENVTSQYKQIEPITVQAGFNVRIILPQAYNDSMTGFLKTDKDSFINCEDVSNTDVLITDNNRSLSISSEVLDRDVNYFRAYGGDSCASGWRVRIVVLETNECEGVDTDLTCSGNGHCALNDNKTAFTCACCSGFRGTFCEQKISAQNSLCDGKSCLNGGTCITVQSDDTDSDVYDPDNSTAGLVTKCLCNSLFSGPQCESRLDHCKSSPCIHGMCKEKIDGYQCYCIPGFHGRQCQLEYNECTCNPCHNHGTCVDRLDRYECHCSPGYTGPNCEIKVDMCHRHPCHMNGTCVDIGNTFMCSCTQGFTGKYCEKRVNECARHPCQNHGTCIDLENGFQCLCPITFAGVHCEYMMDVFAPPLEGSDILGRSHAHNLYIVAGTLSGAIVVILVVLAACYCKMHETYRQISWRRLRTHHRSLSCPDFDACNEIVANGKQRLSVDAICEATSLAFDNGSMDTTNHHHPLTSPRI